MKKTSFILLFLLLSWLASCVSLEQLAPPVNEVFLREANLPPAQVQELRRGRSLYIKRCGSCHSLDAVSAYDISEWHEVFDEGMRKKAKLSASEERQIFHYLKTCHKIQRLQLDRRPDLPK